jgi:ABC-2 type transport system permease protein
MNHILFKYNIKSNLGIFVFITAMLLLYTTISVGMFNPDNAESLEAMFNMLPEGMIKAFGFEGIGTELTQYLASYLYGFIYLLFPAIFTITASNKLIAKHVDSGSMTYLLTTPNKRIKIATTQALYLIIATFVIMAINVSVALIMSGLMFPGLLNITKYLGLNLVTFMVLYTVASIGFFFSCLFNDTRNSLAFGAGIPIVFIVLKMVAGISEDISFLKYFTLYSVVDVDKIMNDGSYVLLSSLALFLVGSLIYAGSVILFNKRSLSL